MIIKIDNGVLTAEIDTLGAELQSVKNTDGTEFIWCGDKNVWGGRSPLLFPICGALKNGKYEYNGTEYFLEKHGFARRTEFECVRSGDEYAEFVLCHSDELKKKYPFQFRLSVLYELKNDSLDVTYKVTNTGENTMYFSLGAHEGYACPDGIENFRLTFADDEKITLYRADENGLITDNGKDFPLSDKSFMLKRDMFVDDALIFLDHTSRKVYLENINTGRKITVDFDGFDYLLIWTKPEGNYVCIEPWTGIPDRADCSGILSEKTGITVLEKDCDYIVKHRVNFKN